tara:strand:+ start:74 stop:385 length:312 start_codon:yes stop_codon:yes gene_type:complete
MTETRHSQTSFFSTGFARTRAGRIVRDVLAALIAVAFLGLVVFLAAMLTAAFLVLAGIGLLAGFAYWLWRKLRGGPRRKGDAEDDILVATRGPDGWTVEGLGR